MNCWRIDNICRPLRLADCFIGACIIHDRSIFDELLAFPVNPSWTDLLAQVTPAIDKHCSKTFYRQKCRALRPWV